MQHGGQPGRLLASATDRRVLMLHDYRDQVAGSIRLAQSVDQIAPSQPKTDLLDRIAELERRITELERR